ncbi:benzoate 4-monooxygenase cytochrome p450 [Niveomyces insectorum RCEF 264]|uniref:Benzoate 4-monooxygenase cytochrome p450 n=1 Tax=Niveomyces insectorum RCEF 264 TaxID=1081102 RepID=A0A168A8M0_9HYPO|nr:benzoate 4-monooxygenase cytochrome p450 [Niveomyces insectorum RCEF 264]
MILERVPWPTGSLWTSVGLGLGLLLLAYTAASSLASWNRLRHIPGPPGAGFSKWWMLRNTLGGHLHLATKAACKQYGPLIRIGPNHLVTNDPDVLRRLWAVRSPYKKGPFYEAVRFNPERDNLVSMRDDRVHAELRAKMAPGYGGKDNEQLEATIDREILVFIDLIERKYLSDETNYRPVDLAHKVQFLTLDVITALAFSKRFGYTEKDTDVYSYIKITEDSMPVMMVLSIFPQLAVVLQSRLLRRLMPSEHDHVGFGKFIAVAKQIVKERLASDKPHRKDMLGSFLAHGLTREEAEGETLLQIIAGSDTTATAIRTTMLYLMSSPQSYHRLAQEVRTAAAAGRISSPVVTDAEARTLPYLQAVIREGLRVNPPVAGTMDVLVPEGGDVLCGYPVPAGTEVGCSEFGVQSLASVYGPDADVFRPERWLEAEADPDDERLKQMTSTLGLVFKYGKWQCLGKEVALIELNKVFVELLRRFDFTLVNPSKPWYSINAGIFIQSGLYTKITRVEPTKA